MSSTKGYHADFYEIIYKNKPYAAEAKRIHTTIAKHSPFKVKSLLELACGTGNHSLNLSRYGYKIQATDKNKDMVRVAKAKLAGVPHAKVDVMDMVHFMNFTQRFDAVICLFDSIGFVQSNENIVSVIKNVSANLKKGGLFVFEYWNAGAMLRSYEPTGLREWKEGERKIVRKSSTTMNYEKQLCKVDYTILDYRGGQLIKQIKESHTNRFFLPQEMNCLLTAGGLTPVALYDGYSGKKKVTEASWHTLCVAQKK
ncbi:MAG TPA: class I SAM-dependent methyltransferase [Chitinophagales bacterium]|nr:class I SAM-dependent methyltransferase [Chitinophagales bacterium]